MNELVEKVRALPACAVRAELDEAERKFIAKHIQPWIEKEHVDEKRNERLTCFEIHGSGVNKWITWFIQEGETCDGCDGDGRIASNKGTLTDCPDCWGSGAAYGEGDTRKLITDYDGEAIGHGLYVLVGAQENAVSK